MDDHRLGIDQWRGRRIANLDAAINARNDLTIHRGIHIGLCIGAARRQQQYDRGTHSGPYVVEKTHHSLQRFQFIPFVTNPEPKHGDWPAFFVTTGFLILCQGVRAIFVYRAGFDKTLGKGLEDRMALD